MQPERTLAASRTELNAVIGFSRHRNHINLAILPLMSFFLSLTQKPIIQSCFAGVQGPQASPKVSQHSLLFLSQLEAPEKNNYKCKNGKTQEEKEDRGAVAILTGGEKGKDGNKRDQIETQGSGRQGDTKEVKARAKEKRIRG